MTPPTLDAEQARALRSILAPVRPPFYGDAEHQPRLFYRSGSTSRVVCTCGAELGIVSTAEGLERVKAMHAEHVASVTS